MSVLARSGSARTLQLSFVIGVISCDMLFCSAYRMLGYTQAIRTGYGSTYGYARSGIIWLSGVNCQGNETNIAQCSFPGWGINNCYHYFDVNVVCDSE